MAFSAEVIHRATLRLEQAKADKDSQTRQKLGEVYSRLPRVQKIDGMLRQSMALAVQAVFTQGGDARQAMEQVRQANLLLQAERQSLIDEEFGPNFIDESPICSRCGGMGYVGTAMCSCLQELCRQEQKKELSLLACGSADFEDFVVEYYPAAVDSRYGASPRAIMERNLKLCKKYAQEFSPKSGNLLFVGSTGLGKTFLSACIAGAAAEKGYWVVYESAGKLFSKLEKNRFSPDEETAAQVRALEKCDLLILDDLGTELPGNFVTAALYELVNERLLAGKPMVISTNLNIEEIGRRYSMQIASRLQGSFQRLTFVGDDIRVLKNRG